MSKKEIGCGYCKKEEDKSCKKRNPKVNQAPNCEEYEHYQKMVVKEELKERKDDK